MTESDASGGVPLLEVRSITKLFGSFAACSGIDLKIAPGEIHALLGENGAGKSTLVKMLFGVLAPTSGEIVWQGSPVTIGSPGEARKTGIGMVFQHFSLFEALTVAENIALSLDHKTPLGQIAEQAAQLSQVLWSTARPALPCRRPVRRRAPAHRDCPCPLAKPAN